MALNMALGSKVLHFVNWKVNVRWSQSQWKLCTVEKMENIEWFYLFSNSLVLNFYFVHYICIRCDWHQTFQRAKHKKIHILGTSFSFSLALLKIFYLISIWSYIHWIFLFSSNDFWCTRNWFNRNKSANLYRKSFNTHFISQRACWYHLTNII